MALVLVPPGRVTRWFDNFRDRHGEVAASVVDGALCAGAADGSTAVARLPFDAAYESHEGARTPAAPDGQDIWVATTEGAGRRTLDWDVRDGRWSVVVMNADGSRGVDTEISAGAEVAFLGTAGWISLGAAMVLLLGAGTLVYAGNRTPREVARAAPAPSMG